jgi:hypothetical protein
MEMEQGNDGVFIVLHIVSKKESVMRVLDKSFVAKKGF